MKKMLKAEPQVLVVISGYSGLTEAPKGVRSHLERQVFWFKIKEPAEAKEIFNEPYVVGEKFAALHHLPC